MPKHLLWLKIAPSRKMDCQSFSPPSLPLIRLLSHQTFHSTWSIGWKPIQIAAKHHIDM